MKKLIILLIAFVFVSASCELMPRNTLRDCRLQCNENKNPTACNAFCDCIHKEGKPLNTCLEIYEKAPLDSTQAH